MKSFSIQKLLLALVVCFSAYCFYHMNFVSHESGLVMLSQFDYMGEMTVKEDKVKEALIVILKSFVEVAL